jgi:hypothetical protein
MDKHCQKPNLMSRKRKRTDDTSSSPDPETPSSFDNDIAHQFVKTLLENAFINGLAIKYNLKVAH